jgi:biopolymer transport protein ExbD
MLYRRFRKIERKTILLPILIPVMNLFLVLLPFVLETSLLQQLTTHEITLPTLKSTANASSIINKEIILHVTRDAILIMFDNNITKINYYENFGSKLEEELLKIRKNAPDLKSIQLKIDNNVVYQLVIDIIDICKRTNVGFEEIVYMDEVS